MTLLVAAACGNDDSDTPAATPETDAGSGATYDSGVTDTTITVGSTCTQTGHTTVRNCNGAKAYFDALNAEGGVNGRKIEYIVYDDEYQPTNDAALVRRLFEEDEIFALVSQMTGSGAGAMLPYIEEHGIPVVGGDMQGSPTEGTWGASEYFFPQAFIEGEVAPQIVAKYAMDKAGCTTYGAVTYEIPGAKIWMDDFFRFLRSRDPDVAIEYEATTAVQDTQYTPHIVQMKEEGVDCFTLGAAGPSMVQFSRQAATQDFDAQVFYPSPAYDATGDVFADPVGEAGVGTYSILQFPPFETADENPAIQQFLDDMEQYAPGATVSSYELLSYAAADVFTEAVRRMGDELTRENLLATLRSFDNYDNGLVATLDYTDGANRGSLCGWIVQLAEEQRWETVAAEYCLEEEELLPRAGA